MILLRFSNPSLANIVMFVTIGSWGMFSWVHTTLYLTLGTRELDLQKLLKGSKFQLALFLQVATFHESRVNKLIDRSCACKYVYLATFSVEMDSYTSLKKRPQGCLNC